MNWQPKTVSRNVNGLQIAAASYLFDLGCREDARPRLVPTHSDPMRGLHDVYLTNETDESMFLAFSEHGQRGRWCWLADVVIPHLPPGQAVGIRCRGPLEDTTFRIRRGSCHEGDHNLIPFLDTQTLQIITTLTDGCMCYNTAEDRYSHHDDCNMWRKIHDRLPDFAEWPVEIQAESRNTIDFVRRHELDNAVPFESALETVAGHITRELRHSPNLLKDVLPEAFETLVGCILHDLGMSLRFTTRGADGGLDIIAVAGPSFSPTTHLVQCKQYNNKKVGVRWVRELMGVKHANRASKALLITTSSFTRKAQAFAAEHPAEISLLDWDRLAGLLANE